MTSEDEFPPGYDGQSQADREDAEELRVQIEREEKAWKDWRADHPSGVYNIPYVAFMAGRKSQRSRIAALEAVIKKAHAVNGFYDRDLLGGDEVDILDILESAPSAALDQMIREAKADGWDEGVRAENDYFGRREDADAAGQGVMVYRRKNPYRNGDA